MEVRTVKFWKIKRTNKDILLVIHYIKKKEGNNMMNVQFNLKAKHLVIGAVVVTGFVFWQANKPLEYDFTSVYDAQNNHHNIHLKTDSNSERYNEKCANELAEHLLDAKISNFDITITNDGEYELLFYNGNKLK